MITCPNCGHKIKRQIKLAKQTDPDLALVIKFILDSRLLKTGKKYILSGQVAGRLQALCRVYTHAEVCAAWSVFKNDKLDEKDRAFWCKGYLPEKFVTQQCFSLCQEPPDYKDYVRRHEEQTFGLSKALKIEDDYEVKSI